jgi:peptide/nickel transport system permease protein
MLRYLARRLLAMIPLLFAISVISFTVIRVAPGQPIITYEDPRGGQLVSPEDLAKMYEKLGLNDPIHVQYWRWLRNVLRGNLGYSLTTRRPVSEIIMQRVPNTLRLTVLALLSTLALAVPLGVISGRYQNSLFDQVVSVITFIGFSLPNFWVALMLIYVFGVHLRWLPIVGMAPATGGGLWASIRHMILPVATFVLVDVGGWMRYQRAGIVEAMQEDYTRTARAKGLPERQVFFRHVWRNALLPIVTFLGLSLSSLIGGSFLIEYVFSWPGMGRLGVEAALARDYPVVMAVTMLASLLLTVGNLLADIAYAVVDPRIRYD